MDCLVFRHVFQILSPAWAAPISKGRQFATKELAMKSLLIIFSLLVSQAAYAASISISPAPSFGKVQVGQSSTISLTVKNNDKRSKARLDSHWFTKKDAFSVVGGTCQYNGWSLAAGKSCTVSVQFAPKVAGLISDSWFLGYYMGTSWTWNQIQISVAGEGVVSAPVTTTTLPASTTTLPVVTTTTLPVTTTTVPPVAMAGWLRTSGNKILNDQGQVVTLKGVNIADPEHLNVKTWERPGVSARSVASLATDQYFAKVVRLPILPGNSAYPNEGFFSPTNGKDVYFRNHVEPLVNELTAKGVYVIIDLHYVSDYQALYPKVEEFWRFMAPKFANNPYVIYEVFNEPILPDDWATWKNTIAQPAVNLIRSLAPNNLVLVGGPYWSSHIAGAATDPIVGSNVAYVAHIYSNQTAAMWEQRYGAVINQFPLFITEWGFETGGTEGGDINFGQEFEAWMSLHGLSWTAWSFDTLWGPKMFNPDWTLKESPAGMGTFVRDLLYYNRMK